jgi:small-conductance mechanosensitive channel
MQETGESMLVRNQENRWKVSKGIKTHFVTIILFFFAISTCAANLILAQNLNLLSEQKKEKPESQIEQHPTAINAIPASDIAQRAEETSTRLLEISADLKPNPNIIDIQDKFPTLKREIDKSISKAPVDEIVSSKYRNIDDIHQNLLRYKTILSQWEAILRKRSEKLSFYHDELKMQNEQWKVTREKAIEEEIPDVLRQRIDDLVNNINSVDRSLKERQNALLIIQNRLSAEETSIGVMLAKTNEARKILNKQWFALDASPLWTALLKEDDETSVLNQIQESWQAHYLSSKNYFNIFQKTFLLHLFVFLALSLVLIYASKRIKRSEREVEIPHSTQQIASRPFSVALLLSIIWGMWFYPHPPIMLSEFFQIILLIPLLRILPGLVPTQMRSSLYGLATIYLLQQFHDILPEHTLIDRLVIILVITFSIIGLGWLLKPESPVHGLSGGTWWRTVINLSKIAFILLIVALISNLIGNTTLSEKLTKGILESTYIALIIYTGYLVVDGLFSLVLKSRTGKKLRMINNYPDLIKKKGENILKIGSVVLWIYGTFYNFEIWEPMTEWLIGFFTQRWTIGNFSVSLGDLLLFGVTIWVSILISRFIRFVLDEDILSRISLPRGVPGTISTLLHYLIIFIGFLIALSAAGIEWSRFTLLAGALGVGIGFGLQNLFERPIQVGDTIEVGELLGEVKRIGIRSSTIRAWTGAEVIVPNGNLISNDMINWTLSDRLRRVEISVGVKYGTNPKLVMDILTEVARNHQDVLNIPEPDCLFLGFGDSSLNFELRFWTGDVKNWKRLSSQVTVNICDALNEAGIEIPFPQRDLHFKSIEKSVKDALIGKDSKSDPNYKPE